MGSDAVTFVVSVVLDTFHNFNFGMVVARQAELDV